MTPLLATIICWLGITGLFYLDRDKSVRTSRALWLPIIWLWIGGSRPLSIWLGIWLGIGPLWTPGPSLEAQLDGSPLDATVFSALAAVAVVVLVRRSRTGALLKASFPVVIYYVYCLLSVCWSHLFEVALKRWVKDVDSLAIILVLVTDPKPIEALRRVFTRVGYVLLPASVLLSKYSPLGRTYDPSGNSAITGVTTNKNSLGLVVFVISLGVFWSFFHLLRAKHKPGRVRRLIAQGTLLGFGIAVLNMARSATSIACFALGSMLIVCVNLPFVRRKPSRIHAVVLIMLCFAGAAMLFGGEAAVVGALGRDTTLTGRTDIWKTVIPMCPNPLIGAGFESFWNTYGGNLAALGPYLKGINEAHNGYIEVYLNLGLVGVCIIGYMLISGYRRASAAFQRNQEIGCLMLAYIATSAVYSISEAGFRELTYTWTFFLLAMVASSGVVAGLVEKEIPHVRRLRARRIYSGAVPSEFGSFSERTLS